MKGRYDALTQLDKKPVNPSPLQGQAETLTEKKASASKPENENDTKTPRHQDTNHDTIIPTHNPSTHPSNSPSLISDLEEASIEFIRKAVKQVGKEGGTYRFTLEEKSVMKQIKRQYEDQGIDTSDIEIIRIGLNYILADFHNRGDESIVAKVLKRLNE